MKLWLDDIRDPPNDSWHIVRTGRHALKILHDGVTTVEEISFDHDLGDSDALTGYDIAAEIERLVFAGRMKVPRWSVHSQNPVGAARICNAMKSAMLFEGRNYETQS